MLVPDMLLYSLLWRLVWESRILPTSLCSERLEWKRKGFPFNTKTEWFSRRWIPL